jgi:hypothetical protein
MIAPALRVALAGALLATAGCASGGGPRRSGSPFSDDPRERKEVSIHIENHNFSDATVWTLVRDGRRQRLGMVTGKSVADFTVPWTFSEPLRIQFDLVAGPRCTTENLVVDPGDTLEMQIAVDLAMMSDWCR